MKRGGEGREGKESENGKEEGRSRERERDPLLGVVLPLALQPNLCRVWDCCRVGESHSEQGQKVGMLTHISSFLRY